jgi:ADP-glucose pyrophosphorylase
LKQREKISNLKNASQKSYSFTFDYLQKNFEKDLQKNLQKQICGASVVQNVKNKETIHAYPVSIYIGSIPCNLYTYIMQTSSIMHFYICFGLCWHQSPKRGRLKEN